MKCVIISDSHQRHDQIEIPEGDVLIHCGDWTNKGSLTAIKDFLDWFICQPCENLVFIAGNHELTLDSPRKDARDLVQKYLGPKCHYLENSSVEIDGFKIYGSPYTPAFYDWAFNRQRGKDIAIEWAKIPNDTNILITHGPCYGILDLVEYSETRDLHQGCQDLLERIKDLKQLKLHAAGHLHSNHGIVEIGGVKFVNASSCNEEYDPVNKPIVVEL